MPGSFSCLPHRQKTGLFSTLFEQGERKGMWIKSVSFTKTLIAKLAKYSRRASLSFSLSLSPSHFPPPHFSKRWHELHIYNLSKMQKKDILYLNYNIDKRG